jgi:hypothetical protein
LRFAAVFTLVLFDAHQPVGAIVIQNAVNAEA